MQRSPWERALVVLLRLSGGVTLTAFFAIFLPTEWMAITHRALGLGEFPAVPLVDYLTRSAAALYAVHGGLLLVVSRDVRRHRPIVAYVALTYLGFGAVILAIDLHAGMPAYWTLAEGPPVVALGLAMLFLLRLVPHPRSG